MPRFGGPLEPGQSAPADPHSNGRGPRVFLWHSSHWSRRPELNDASVWCHYELGTFWTAEQWLLLATSVHAWHRNWNTHGKPWLQTRLLESEKWIRNTICLISQGPLTNNNNNTAVFSEIPIWNTRKILVYGMVYWTFRHKKKKKKPEGKRKVCICFFIEYHIRYIRIVWLIWKNMMV